MSRNCRLLQGVRGQKILAQLKNNNDDLDAHENSEENIPILEKSLAPPSSTTNCAAKENLNFASKKAAKNQGPVLNEEDWILIATMKNHPIYFRKRSLSLSDVSRGILLSSNHKNYKSIPALFRYHTTGFCSKKDTENFCDSVNIKRAASKGRSLLLSDLTSDTTNDFVCIRKIQSVPALVEDSIIFQANLFLPYHSVNTIPNDNPSDCELDENISDYGDMMEGRKRRKIANPKSWKKNEAKQRRMQGKEYLGYRKPKNDKLHHDTIRPATQMGQKCTSNFCFKSKLRGGHLFSEQKRMQIHEQFWKCMSWDQRKMYVAGLVMRLTTVKKTKTSYEVFRREGTLAYHIPINGDENYYLCSC